MSHLGYGLLKEIMELLIYFCVFYWVQDRGCAWGQSSRGGHTELPKGPRTKRGGAQLAPEPKEGDTQQASEPKEGDAQQASEYKKGDAWDNETATVCFDNNDNNKQGVSESETEEELEVLNNSFELTSSQSVTFDSSS